MNAKQKKIHPRGFWQAETINHHYDDSFCLKLKDMCRDFRSVVDFGCGNAGYAKSIKKENPDIVVDAFDGNPNVGKITNGFGENLDLSREFNLHRKYDVVISLEVAEHIPKEHEATYINNISSHCNRLLVFSWAKVGQGGKGHINEQNKDYVLKILREKGFVLNRALSEELQSSATVCYWFKETSLVFDRK